MNKKDLEKIVIVVDMINGFVNEGAMADPYIAHIIPEIKRLVEDNKDGAIFIRDCHEEDAVEFKSYPVHCLKGTSESEVVDELKVYTNNENTFEKNSTSAMFAEGFIDTIKEMENLKEVIITGCCTDICVLNLALPLNNYFNQENRNIDIIVPKNAVETFGSDSHARDEYNNIAYKLMMQAGIKVI